MDLFMNYELYYCTFLMLLSVMLQNLKSKNVDEKLKK